jgi:transposase-like protein
VAAFCRANGQVLLPLVELVTQARLAVDTVIEELSQQTVETILELSAEQVAGARTPGQASGEIRWHGRQRGRVSLADRQLAVQRPRLRRKSNGPHAEIPVPAYEALRRSPELGRRMFSALLRGVSTRQYRDVLPQMAQTVGVSKSAVSREAVEASSAQLTVLLERRWEEVDLLAIYIDGQQHGNHHVISAVGVDSSGKKHVLGLQEGATENAAAAKVLLIHLREHGVDPKKQYLFIIDGAKALRAAIREVYGAEQPVQRCRKHKVRNVLEELPKSQHAQVGVLMRAAYKLENAAEGMARLEKLARFLEHQWLAAAASLREGLEETFTLNRLGLPPRLHRCLATTNLIESPQSGVAKRTGNVSRWRDADMVLRWVAGAYLATEKNFRKIQGYEDLWVLAVALGRTKKSRTPQEKVA